MCSGSASRLLNARGTYVQGWVDTPGGGAVPSGTYVLNSDLPVVPNVVTAAWWPALLAVAVVALAAAGSRRSRRGSRRRAGGPPAHSSDG